MLIERLGVHCAERDGWITVLRDRLWDTVLRERLGNNVLKERLGTQC